MAAKYTDAYCLTMERIAVYVHGDFRALMLEAAPEDRRIFNWHDPQRDAQGMFNVDRRINGMKRPLFVFANSAGDA